MGRGADSTEIDSLLRAADTALYRAKERGRNWVESAPPTAETTRPIAPATVAGAATGETPAALGHFHNW